MAAADLKIPVEQLRRRCDPFIFEFESTADIPPLDDAIGQERAVRAISFGIDIESRGYHIFALGPGGTGKTTMVMGFLRQKAATQPVPDDWCYVNSFDDHDTPVTLRLAVGIGRQFKNDMRQLVDNLKAAIAQAFHSEEYQQAQERLLAKIKQESEQHFTLLDQHATEKGFKLVTMPQGVAFAPLRDGEVMSPEELDNLDEAENERLDEAVAVLQEETRDIMHLIRQLEVEIRAKQHKLEEQTARFATEHLFEEQHKKYADIAEIIQYLERLQVDVLDNIDLFRNNIQKQRDPQQAREIKAVQERYEVNLVVDNSETRGAPVIFEGNPHHHNLIGRIEHEVQQGALVTNFMMIKSGALMRANGGYLVMEAHSLLMKPFAWEALKTALKNSEIQMGVMAEEHQVFLTRSLQPQPIPLDVRVVLIGDPQIYYLLYHLDEDFRELFKVKADFATEMFWDATAPQLYARFIAKICQTQGLCHFAPSGVALLVEESARSVADKNKLATRFGDVVHLIQQASYWAKLNEHLFVTADDIRQAQQEKRCRDNRIEEQLQEMIADGTVLIDTDGTQIGQINGLSVLAIGDYSFGKPSRITARTYVGSAGMVNIDREIELGGRIHNKGVLILSGYLGGKYAQETPLVLSASITFEQLYEEVEGDSASSAELYALLSSLSGYPLRQDLAVTGSVNQRGQIQAIGGVNEKIEGFYDVCCLKGLTGTQGVVIPRSNVGHLMLREDVVEAVGAGQFHIYAVATVDEGIELLTSIPAGELQADGTYPTRSVHCAVQERLQELVCKARANAPETTNLHHGNGVTTARKPRKKREVK
jgi:lon-related putative ATP-dependent protease